MTIWHSAVVARRRDGNRLAQHRHGRARAAERHDLAASRPAVVAALLARLAEHNASAVPCCICTGSGRTAEMDVPPLEGYWYAFHDQTHNPDPNCALQAEPPLG